MEAELERKYEAALEAKLQAKLAEATIKIRAELAVEAEQKADVIKRLMREKAARNLKRGKHFGNKNTPENFAWPTEADIVAMPLDKPVKVESVSYKTYKYKDGDLINEIQLHYSNGVSSPAFKGSIDY